MVVPYFPICIQTWSWIQVFRPDVIYLKLNFQTLICFHDPITIKYFFHIYILLCPFLLIWAFLIFQMCGKGLNLSWRPALKLTKSQTNERRDRSQMSPRMMNWHFCEKSMASLSTGLTLCLRMSASSCWP